MACTHPQTVPEETFRLVPRSRWSNWILEVALIGLLLPVQMLYDNLIHLGVFQHIPIYIQWNLPRSPDPSWHRSSKPYTNFPLSWMTSSKTFQSSASPVRTSHWIESPRTSQWLDRNPFSPPHETLSTFNTSACRRISNKSDRLSSVLNSAESIHPATLGSDVV